MPYFIVCGEVAGYSFALRQDTDSLFTAVQATNFDLWAEGIEGCGDATAYLMDDDDVTGEPYALGSFSGAIDSEH